MKGEINMGCWYETCNVSHLPIVTDDEIVVIPLLKRNRPHKSGFYNHIKKKTPSDKVGWGCFLAFKSKKCLPFH